MFKLGRGGGRGGNVKRPLHHPPPAPHGTRPVGASSARALSANSSGGRGRGAGGPASVVGGQATEESFSLVHGKLLSFGAIIRLAPDLVEEIKKAEARGAAVKIKFDANSNDPALNILDVDGKEFRFTWSRDFGDLCDIYEERESGEDGNGLLVERGSAWRKLNVQRVLDDTIKNHVKMMSEKAERQKGSRKAIVLDPTNSSVKNQSSASVEGSMRRMPWKRKKEPPNKSSRPEPNKVLNLGSSTFKPSSSTKQPMRGRNSVSPQRSPLEKPGHGSSLSPYGAQNSSKYPATSDNSNPMTSNKGDASNYSESEKILHEVPHKDAFGNKTRGTASAKPMDLRSMLISMLLENPKGMSFKAIEKAVAETMPNSSKMIEAVLKNIANFISPGKYVLKSGTSMESSLRRQSDSGSSPESTRQDAQGLLTAEPMDKTAIEEIEPSLNKFSVADEVVDILDKTDKTDISSNDLTKDKQVNNDSEGRSSSSSESGSDSDSESESSDSGSDSGSPSRSRSKTRSPADSASASSSDSESDGSSSSKETDIDVDITSSGDEKAEIKLSPSPRPWQSHDDAYNIVHEDGIDHLAPLNHPPPDITEAGEDVARMDENNTKIDNIIESLDIAEYETEINNNNFEERPLPSEALKGRERGQTKFEGSLRSNIPATMNLSSNEKAELPKNTSNNDSTAGISEKIPKSNSRWSSEGKHHEVVGNYNLKSVKGTSSSENFGHRREADLSGQVNRTPRKAEENQNKELKKLDNRSIASDDYMVHESEKGSASAGSTAYACLNRKRRSPDFLDVSQLDAQESSRRYGEASTRRKPFNKDKSGRSADSSDPSTNDDERTSHPWESDSQVSNRWNIKDKGLDSSGKSQRDSVHENFENGNRHPRISDQHNIKMDEQKRIPKDDGKSSTLHKSNTGAQSTISTKGYSLKRELSDLEVGELREPSSTEDAQVSKRQLDRKGSFKASKTRIAEPVILNAEAIRGRSASDLNQDPIRKSPVLDSRINNSQDGLSRKVSEELAKPQMRPPSQLQQRLKTDQLDFENSQFGRIHDSTWTDDSKETSWKKELLKREAASNGDRKMESPEEDILFFSKYEKDDPELRGPIKDFNQYKEYMEEFTEKFKCYNALNEQIKKIRTDFLKIGENFPELAKGKDKKAYDDCCQRMLKFHQQHKKRVRRIKKTFVMLHQELETLKRRIKDFAEEYTRD